MEPPNKEKRFKREIANSNERRRMQSINAGFQKLKRLLPVNDGEKISKANILQHAADFIANIERERAMLAEQNTLLRRILMDLKCGTAETISDKNSPTKTGLPTTPGVGAAKAAIALPLEVPYTSDSLTKSPSQHSPQSQDHHHLHHNSQAPPGDEFELDLMTTGPRKLLKTTNHPTSVALKLAAAALEQHQQQQQESGASKDQNLDTICKAIMKIEGDRVFKNEKLGD